MSSRLLKFMTARANGKKGELFLYGDIGGGSDAPNTASINQEMQALGSVEEINIYINSAGGNIVDGMGIYQVLLRNKARKVVHIDYLAASIASVIAMVGDEIRIAGNGRMMIHRASSIVAGSVDDMQLAIQVMRGFEDDIVKTYVARTRLSADRIRKMMAAETWMNAEEAKSLGFVDKVDTIQIGKSTDSSVINQYRRVPRDLRSPAKEKVAARIASNEVDLLRMRIKRPSSTPRARV